MGGSAYAGHQVASSMRVVAPNTSSVSVASVTINPAPGAPQQRTDAYRERIKADFYALRSDVGLA